MGENEKIYTDFPIGQNPDLSAKANKFYKYFMFFMGLLWIVIGSVNLHVPAGNTIINIFQIVIGSILLLLLIFQPRFHKKFGRLYIGFGSDSIDIKNDYFKPVKKVLWNEISKVKIHYSKFIIYQDKNQDEAIIFEVPYSINENIRQKLREYAKLKSYKLDE